jgi:hypothetical protein
MESTAPVPGYSNCYVTREGHVYNHGKLKVPIIKGNNAPKVRLQENGIAKEHGLATLVALAFVPNPHNFKKAICLDRNNRNCRSDNLAWVSNREYVRHSLFPGKPLEPITKEFVLKQPSTTNPKKDISHNRQTLLPVKIKSGQGVPPLELNAVPIPGFPGYYITLCGKVYSKDKLLTPQQCCNKANRIKVKSSSGVLERHTVAWLMATTFIPNLSKLPKVVFIDKIKSNCTVENLRWVSLEDYYCYYRSFPDILGAPTPKKKAEPVWIDPERVPVEGFEGYFISPKGIVYKGNRIIKPRIKKGKSLKVSLVIPGTVPIARKHLGLAKLIAQHFIPNPQKHPYIIFKDHNNQHCWKENIAWVDGETFIYYCGIYHKPGTGKIVLEREEAIQLCTNQLLKNYYETLDSYWLERSWENVEERLKGVYKWASFRSDCYIYFMDRVERFSIIKDPVGLLWAYLKGLKAKLRQEISYDIPIKALLKTDECLRNRTLYRREDE